MCGASAGIAMVQLGKQRGMPPSSGVSAQDASVYGGGHVAFPRPGRDLGAPRLHRPIRDLSRLFDVGELGRALQQVDFALVPPVSYNDPSRGPTRRAPSPLKSQPKSMPMLPDPLARG